METPIETRITAMFERYTEKARRAIFFARYEASQFGSPYIETEHLLLGLLREYKALIHRFRRSHHSHPSVESIRKQIEAHTTVREKTSTSVDLPLSDECKRILAFAAEEADALGHKHVGTEHLLLGLLREEKCFAAEILKEHGVGLDAVREELRRIVTESPILHGAGGAEARSASRIFSDLTQAAADGALQALIEREVELESAIEVLCNMRKRNLLLVGEQGVGKTAIIEGLAQRIADGKVPAPLREKKILAIEPVLFARFAQDRRQFDAIVNALGAGTNPENVILFVDGREGLLGAVANGLRLAPAAVEMALQAGAQCIGAGTANEYETARTAMPSIDEWFRAVYVRPLNEAAALRVIQARKVRLEQFHEVSYADEALLLAAGWAGSLIAEGVLPGKAFELLDAAGAAVNLRRIEIPEIAEMQKRLRLIAKRMEDAIASHEFEKAKFYSEEEQKEQENLRAAQEQHGPQEPVASVVERSDVEQVIARWSDYPYSS